MRVSVPDARLNRVVFCLRRGVRMCLQAALAALPLAGYGQGFAMNPFKPPTPAQYAPDRDYDLRHILVRLNVDWDSKSLSGTVTHTLAPLRDNLQAIIFDAGTPLNIQTCTVDGANAKFTHENNKLSITPPSPLARNQEVVVAITYTTHPPEDGGVGGIISEYGFHWVVPDKFDPARKPGFWTHAEPDGHRNWLPIYDYPNDRASSETIVEVPPGWYVIGNGTLLEDREDPTSHRRTFHWKITQPHATYLLSLAAGEMDVAQDEWSGVPLLFAGPKGEGNLFPTSFQHTKDMLQFFSDTTGVKYPWPKYAQTAMFDFGGGQENVSATTLGEFSLTDSRQETDDDLLSHEMAHQWFGDYVTCKDWGNIWLNESFAEFFMLLYTEHSKGKDAYDRSRFNEMQGYLFESRRYKRPIVTRFYPNADAMFDSHTYPKGALVLHMLRRYLGDADFFRGIHAYLDKKALDIADTDELIRVLTETTGRDVEPFFDQWIYKPGHPVLRWNWRWDAGSKQVALDIAQEQDTKDGTPIYTMELPVGLLLQGRVERSTITLNQKKQTFMLKASQQPDAVLLDIDRDRLMERRYTDWHSGEANAVFQHAPDALDREDAAFELLKHRPSDTALLGLLETAEKDGCRWLLADVVRQAGTLGRPVLRATFRKLMADPDTEVRSAAIGALGLLPRTSDETAILRALVNDREPYAVVRAALGALAQHDADTDLPVFRQALEMASRNHQIAVDALAALGEAKTEQAENLLLETIRSNRIRRVREAALFALMGHPSQRAHSAATLIALLHDEDTQMRDLAIRTLADSNDPNAALALRELADTTTDNAVREAARRSAEQLEARKARPVSVERSPLLSTTLRE